MGEGRNYWVGQKVRSKAKLKRTFWPTCSTINKYSRKKGLSGSSGLKNPPADGEDTRDDPWVGKIPWRRKWQPISVFLPGESHGQRSLVGLVHGVAKSVDMTERLSTSTRKRFTFPIPRKVQIIFYFDTQKIGKKRMLQPEFPKPTIRIGYDNTLLRQNFM